MWQGEGMSLPWKKKADPKAQHEAEEQAEQAGSPLTTLGSSLGGMARRVASQALSDPRVQETRSQLKHRAEEARAGWRDRADRRLEDMLSAKGSAETEAILAQRREERDLKAGILRARSGLLAEAVTPEERRVLLRVIEATPWAGGQGQTPRYTRLLDELAPSGDPAAEMAVHRALWALAERRVLAVSPHGEVTACPLVPTRALP